MTDIIELKATDLAAMLCSRVCHDLINPIGAIGNGLEVLGDPIASAAKQSRAKLEFARLAYGASSTSGTDIDTRECERVARVLFEIEKALYELRYELNNRPDWVRIPLQGLLGFVASPQH